MSDNIVSRAEWREMLARSRRLLERTHSWHGFPEAKEAWAELAPLNRKIRSVTDVID